MVNVRGDVLRPPHGTTPANPNPKVYLYHRTQGNVYLYLTNFFYTQGL